MSLHDRACKHNVTELGRWRALVGEAMHIAVLWTRPGLLGRGRRGRVQTRRPRAARRRAAHTSENSWTDRRTGVYVIIFRLER